MSFKLEAGKMYSAPIVFGPALCPVQNIDGNRYEVQEHVRQYTTVLYAHKPGDKVKIVVLRGDEKTTLDVTLGKRGESEKQ